MWLASPALPVGGFSYSEALEAAVDAGLVRTEAQAGDLVPMTHDGAAAWLQARSGNGVFVTTPAASTRSAMRPIWARDACSAVSASLATWMASSMGTNPVPVACCCRHSMIVSARSGRLQ